jgi:hypothetical protein
MLKPVQIINIKPKKREERRGREEESDKTKPGIY